MPKVVYLELKLPPQLAHMTVEEYRAEHDRVLATMVEAAKDKFAGRGFRGLERLRRVRHTERATSPEPRGKGKVKPHLACTCKTLRLELKRALRRFRREYRAAWQRWVSGDRDVVFPLGTYAMRHRHGARVAEPAPG